MTISNKKIILSIIALIFLWMLSGIFSNKKVDDSAKIAPHFSPEIMYSTATLKMRFFPVTGTAFANDSVQLFPQMSGKIVKRFADSGMKMKKSDKIIQIENTAIQQKVREMEEKLDAAKTRYDAAIELSRKKLSSKLNLEDAQGIFNAAQTAIADAKTELQNSFIIAPFDGYIDNISVQEGDIIDMTRSQSVATFINLEKIEVEAFLSQKEHHIIKNAKEGIVINDSNQLANGTIKFIGQSANNDGTFVIKMLVNNNINLIDGETVNLKLKIGEVKAHKVPATALIIDQHGNLAIKLINNGNILTQKIDIIDEDIDGLWVTNLPNECSVIIAGQSYGN